VLLGGILTDGLGWEWVLWVNVPVATVVAHLAPGLIAESRSEATSRRFDLLGAVTVTAGLSLLVYAIVDAPEAGWGSGQTLGLLAAAALLLVAFVAIELRSDAPLVSFRIFRSRTLTGANAVGLLIGASLLAMFFFITLYLQQVLGYSAIETGLAYLPLALTIIVVSGVASQLVTRVGFKPVLMLGMTTIGVALVWFSQISVDGGFGVDVLGPSMLAGAGLGLAMVPDTIAAMTDVRPEEAGLASGLINTSQQIGGALGLAVLATVANSRTDDVLAGSGGDSAALPNALTEGFQSAFLGGAAIAAVGLMLTLILIPGRAHLAPEPAEDEA
jgi:MFS family permease